MALLNPTTRRSRMSCPTLRRQFKRAVGLFRAVPTGCRQGSTEYQGCKLGQGTRFCGIKNSAAAGSRCAGISAVVRPSGVLVPSRSSSKNSACFIQPRDVFLATVGSAAHPNSLKNSAGPGRGLLRFGRRGGSRRWAKTFLRAHGDTAGRNPHPSAPIPFHRRPAPRFSFLMHAGSGSARLQSGHSAGGVCFWMPAIRRGFHANVRARQGSSIGQPDQSAHQAINARPSQLFVIGGHLGRAVGKDIETQIGMATFPETTYLSRAFLTDRSRGASRAAWVRQATGKGKAATAAPDVGTIAYKRGAPDGCLCQCARFASSSAATSRASR